MRVDKLLDIFTYSPAKEHKTAVIIGGGSSVGSFDFSTIEGHYPVIAVNDAFRLEKVIIDYVWFGDERWFAGDKKKWEGNRKHLKYEIKENKVFTCAMSLEDDSDVWCFKRGKPVGIDVHPDHVSWNRSSGASAINFAYHLGARKILLVGFDMKRGENGATHWHDFHPTKDLDIDDLFIRYKDAFQHIKKDADALGVEIYNLNPDSAIEDFPKMTYKEAMFAKYSLCS